MKFVRNRKTKIFFAVSILTFASLLIVVPTVFAAETLVEDVGPESLTEVKTIITTIVNWFQAVVLILGIMMIVWAGLTWMIAGGNDDKLKEARQRLIWGLVGIAVALFAGVAQKFIESIIK